MTATMETARKTRYASLFSLAGQERLAGVLDDKCIQGVAAGRLKIDDILGMSEDQTNVAFNLIRWAESSGIPTCPRCRADTPYWIKSRSVWRCRSCAHSFSSTSGTLLSARKVPFRNYLFALSAVLDRDQFTSLLGLTRELGLNYKSAHDTTRKLKACVTDNAGCTVPFSLLERAAWMIRRSQIRAQLRVLPPASLNYPYLREQRSDDYGADLLAFASKLVPQGLPDYVRADICQDMIVAILSGESKRETISRDAKAFITKVLQDSPWKYKWMSFDAPLSAEDGRSLHEMMAAPEGASYDDAVAITVNDSRERARLRISGEVAL